MSNSADLQKAIKCFAIKDIYIRESHWEMSPSFDPSVPTRIRVELHVDTTGVELGSIQAEGNPAQHYMRVHVSTGMRFMDSSSRDDGEQAEQNSGNVKAELRTTFVAEYHNNCPGDISQESIDVFAKRNAPFHVWPYWREHIHSVVTKARLPPFTLPMFALGNSEEKPVEAAEKK